MNSEFLYVFGTGNAQATRCYNTCFAIKDGGEYFMVDAGGGNGILRILDDMSVDLSRIHHIFVTHEHTDHILGIVWMVRMMATAMRKGKYEGDLNIYCHGDLIETIKTLCRLTMQGKFYKMIGERILLVPVRDGETVHILDYDVTFFDILSTKAKQYGFTMTLKNGKKFTCCGDEPFNPDCLRYVEGSSWLLHEAFCLYADRDRFEPYEKHHSTVREACELAEQLGVENLVLWHTEDKNPTQRKALYTQEGRAFYHGNLLVPDDGEIIELL
ncbi:MAG: MBL fold metallo-hydrolase [Clostridiales bacterium]|nr:MBL fold metallo-hydrolase [Clostridiales bacterium]